MRLATEQATSEHAAEVTIHHVREALKRIVETGLDQPVPAGPTVGNFPEEPYQFLTRRLVTMHMVLTGRAGTLALEQQADEATEVAIKPEHIEQAWEEAGTRPRLEAILLLRDQKASQ